MTREDSRSVRVPKRRLRIAAAFSALIVVLIALVPRGPLERYTSPVLHIQGKSVRIELLVPSGWTDCLQEQDGDDVTLHLTRRPRLAWLPRFVRRFVVKDDGIDVLVNWGNNLQIDVGPKSVAMPSDAVQSLETTSFTAGSIPAHLHYANSDHEEYESTFRLIRDSFRVVPSN